MSKLKDTLYKQSGQKPGSFVFDQHVAAVFEDMISRSVPGYQQILEMLPTLTRYFRQESANYYDLGCSLGAGLLAIATGLNDEAATLVGLDTSAPMLEQAQKNLAHLKHQSVDLRNSDIRAHALPNAAMVLLNFTLQFVPLADRFELLNNIYRGLLPKGVLILSEKLKFDEPLSQALFTTIHHQYKVDQGYSALEISRKRDAIENVLIPETLATHIERLQEIGFSIVTPWVQNLQFVSIVAVK